MSAISIPLCVLGLLLRSAALLCAVTAPLSAQLPGTGGNGPPILDLQKGIGLLRAEKFAEARDHFTELAARQEHTALPCYSLALAHVGLEDSTGALAALDEAVARGWEDPPAWRSDPALSKFAEEDATFAAGLDALLARIVARRERGTTARRDLSTLEFTDGVGDSRTLAEFVETDPSLAGRPRTALLFLNADGSGLTALWSARAELEGRDDVGLIVFVEVAGKQLPDRIRSLDLFRRSFELEEQPTVLSDVRVRRALRPWHAFPTLLVLDDALHTIAVVDGFPADLEERYRNALAAPGTSSPGSSEATTPDPKNAPDPAPPPAPEGD